MTCEGNEKKQMRGTTPLQKKVKITKARNYRSHGRVEERRHPRRKVGCKKTEGGREMDGLQAACERRRDG